MIKRLVEICRSHTLRPSGRTSRQAVIAEPYIPYIPKNWNRILVLAEAQNLSKSNEAYVKRLRKSSPEERIRRLNKGKVVMVAPWDDGSLKIAVEAALSAKADETAVSNSVLWSLVDEKRNNRNPSEVFISLSARVWEEMLPVMEPRHMVTSGNIANKMIASVAKKLNAKWKHTPLRLPSPMAMSRVSGMFWEEDLLIRYPEVHRVVKKHRKWLEGGYRSNKIFFACHAVSAISEDAG